MIPPAPASFANGGHSPAAQQPLRKVRQPRYVPAHMSVADTLLSPLIWLGARVLGALAGVGRLVLFSLNALRAIITPPWYPARLFEQMALIGWFSLPVVGLTALFELIQETPDEVGHLLLIGHNPGLEDLLLLATEGDDSALRTEAEQKYPTATFATIDLPASGWPEVQERLAGRLMAFVRPRDLDATLGPDD